MMHRLAVIAFCSAALAGIATAGEVSDGKILATEKFEGQTVAFDLIEGKVSNVMLRIVGPVTLNTKRETKAYEAQVLGGDSLPAVRLADHGEVQDGAYGYQLTGNIGEWVDKPKGAPRDNGRGKPVALEAVTFSLAGQFLVQDGRIVEFDADAEDKGEPGRGEEPVDDWDEGDKPGEPEQGGDPDRKPASDKDREER